MSTSDFAKVCQALSDEGRLRALVALRRGELCACQLIELLGLAPSTVSRHMAVLRDAGLIHARKAGRWMHYRLADQASDPVRSRQAISWALSAIASDPQLAADTRRLAVITTISPEALCEMQRQGVSCCAPPAATKTKG